MDEQDWMLCEHPRDMLKTIRRVISPRKFRLFVCACCVPLWDEMTPGPARKAVEVLERYADRLASERELDEARESAAQEAHNIWLLIDEVSGGWAQLLQAQARALQGAADAALRADVAPQHWEGHWDLGGPLQGHLLRDVFGNPFRPFAFDSAWRTQDVHALAASAYQERNLASGHLDHARLAVLSDAVEEAGCTNADLLAHLRGPGPHVRGCWPLDMILGRK